MKGVVVCNKNTPFVRAIMSICIKLDADEHVTGEESALNVQTDSLSNTYTMFVLSMIMASVFTIPVIIGATQMTAMWRLMKKV